MKTFELFELAAGAWHKVATIQSISRSQVIRQYSAGHRGRNCGKVKVRVAR